MFESPVYALYSRLFEKNEQQNTEQNENKKKKTSWKKNLFSNSYTTTLSDKVFSLHLCLYSSKYYFFLICRFFI